LSRVEGKPRRLIIGIGNPSRGDDALGPLAIERLQDLNLADVELLGDFQLQVEFVLDLAGRDAVIFIDASVDPALAGFSFLPVRAQRDTSYSSHALSPEALLAAYAHHHGRPPPPCHVLAIRGHAFGLGEGLSAAAAAALDDALGFLTRRLNAA